jgi:hypothetical protein
VSIKSNYKIESIPKSQTYDWLLNKHYAKRIPSISYAFGLYKDKVLRGVCTFGSPPSNALCIGVCGKDYSSSVIELNRLCVDEMSEKNITSYFLSSCLKRLPTELIIVSYADTSMNHHGYIYQATNWIYTGLSAKRTERYDPDNPNKHSKTVTETMNYFDLAIRERPQKHRYIYFNGSKSFKKKMNRLLNYNIHPYPKGNNKRYDASYKPKVQGKLF